MSIIVDYKICRSSIKIQQTASQAKFSHHALNSINWYVYIYDVHNIEIIFDVIWNSKHLRFNYHPLMTLTFISKYILLKVSCWLEVNLRKNSSTNIYKRILKWPNKNNSKKTNVCFMFHHWFERIISIEFLSNVSKQFITLF